MTRAHAIAGLLSVAAVMACTTASPPEAPTGATPAEPTPAAPPTARMDVPSADGQDGEAQWTCTDDEDCTMTCALGSVSKAWIEARPNADDCDDGCGWSHGQEKCQQGQCVAMKEDGTINAQCTHRSQ